MKSIRHKPLYSHQLRVRLIRSVRKHKKLIGISKRMKPIKTIPLDDYSHLDPKLALSLLEMKEDEKREVLVRLDTNIPPPIGENWRSLIGSTWSATASASQIALLAASRSVVQIQI